MGESNDADGRNGKGEGPTLTGRCRILVRMTRTKETRTGHWALQDAKARFSELVRKAKTEGPQRITVHGREEVVVVSVEEYRRVKGQRTGQALVKVLQDSPLQDLSMDRPRTPGRVRDVEL
jgi:prevent-host-death family protein